MHRLLLIVVALLTAACAQTPALRGTGDLGIVIERARGSVAIVDTSARAVLGRVEGLGDLSHASAVFSRDGRYAYVFGRDGGLTKVDVLTATIAKRIVQAGNSIGGAISQDGRLVVAQNYEPGGIKAFDADTLELVADVPATYGSDGRRSKVVGLADLPGLRFAYALFDAGEIRVTDLTNPREPRTQSFAAGSQPYDGLVTPDGRHYLAGLFGEDGIALLDTWRADQGARKILSGYGRQVWVNFAFPDNGWVQVIDTLSGEVVQTLAPGKAVLHMEFTPRGEHVWISARDDNQVAVYDTQNFARLTSLPLNAPSGIFFSTRAARIGF